MARPGEEVQRLSLATAGLMEERNKLVSVILSRFWRATFGSARESARYAPPPRAARLREHEAQAYAEGGGERKTIGD